MEIYLYRNNKRYNSLYVPEAGASHNILDVQIRGGVSITAPVFVFTAPAGDPEYYNYNYIYVPKWERYYFINNVEIDGNRVFLSCKEDTLGTYRDIILNSTLYCVRSSSAYNPELTDTLFPATAPAASYVLNMSTPWASITEGNYVVAVASGGNEQTHIGCNVYYILDSAEMSEFMYALMSKANISLSGLADSITKTMVDPLQYIRSVYWFPFNLQCSTMSSNKIDFAWWSADCDTKAIVLNYNTDAYTRYNITIPYSENFFETKYDEFRYQHFAPYSRYTLTAYPFGVLELPTALISYYDQGNNIILQITVDHITGMGELIVYNEDMSIPYLVTTAQVAVEIPIGEVLQDFGGAIFGTVSAGLSAVSGNVVGAASGVYNAVESIVPSPTVQGTAGGFAQLMLEDDWSLTRYFNPNFPDLELQGGVCCQNKKVSDLSGFASFSDPEIIGTMLLEEKNEIQNLLADGIFI